MSAAPDPDHIPLTLEQYVELRRRNPSLFFSSPAQHQMIADRKALGLAFYDLFQRSIVRLTSSTSSPKRSASLIPQMSHFLSKQIPS